MEGLRLFLDRNDYVKSSDKIKILERFTVSQYENITEARDRIGDFLTNVYNQKRPHSALGYLTPMEFQRQNLS